MQLTKLNLIRNFILLIATLLLTVNSFAAEDPVNTQPLIGNQGQIAVGAVSFVTDMQYFLNTPPLSPENRIVSTNYVRNYVAVSINEEAGNFITSDFDADIVLRIHRYNSNQELVDSIDRTFSIQYREKTGDKHRSLDYFSFENAFQVRITVMSINNHGASWDITQALRIENTITSSRDYVFNCNTLIPDLSVNYSALQDELTVNWTNPQSGQTEYDLEWAWIDISALDDYKDLNGSYIQDLIFSDNATRVTISDITYNVPLLYDGEGYLFVRVRPAQINSNEQRFEGNWTWKNNNTEVSYHFMGHEGALNWQASTSYAEDGKRKSVIQYFDGSLRTRQTVTKDNVSKTTVVAESFYDYQGRPVVQVLPAPTLNSIIAYSKNFNQAINTTGYPKWVYDEFSGSSNVCESSAMAMSTASGAARYYSSQNTQAGTGNNKFIPSAEGVNNNEAHPFTETRFMPDGRLAYQSGVGKLHQIGEGHDTKYYYEVPAQEELDALFGTDAGINSHYSKNIVKDANGQYSVSYVDMHGRTVATALAGDAPANLQPLEYATEAQFTKQLIDQESNRVVGRSIISTKPLVVMKTGNYTFSYELNPKQLSLLACVTGADICYDCLYDLKIVITPDCEAGMIAATNGEYTIENGSYVVTANNFTPGADLTDPTCSNDGNTGTLFNKVFTINNLPEGSYTITKTLTLSQSAQDIYREDVYIKYDTCKQQSEFIYNEMQASLANSNCQITCESCTTAIGTLQSFTDALVSETGLTLPLSEEMLAQVENSYNEALDNCNWICNGNNEDGMDHIRSIRRMMLIDVSPGNGQYAKLEDLNKHYNVFKNENIDRFQVFPTGGGPAYLHPIKHKPNTAPQFGFYYNQAGVKFAPSPTLTPQAFTDMFESAWAEQLLPHHPEYCLLKTATEVLPASYKFEADLLKLETWNDVVNATTIPGQYITNLFSKDPFFSSAVLGSNYQTNPFYLEMLSKINTYQSSTAASGPNCTTPPANTSITLSMWQLAQGSVFCRDESNSNNCNPLSPIVQCFNSYAANPSVNYTSGCAADWDMVWKAFRSMYLNERRKLVNNFLFSQSCNRDKISLFNQPRITSKLRQLGYEPRFIDLNVTSGNGMNDLDVPVELQDFFNSLSTGNSGSITQAEQLEEAQYQSTCEGYVATWVAQLMQCNVIATRWENQALKDLDLAWLKPRLVAICIGGADRQHFLGSSSLAPSQPSLPGGYRDFPAVIKAFLISRGVNPLTAVCNPYLITVPAPYNHQPAIAVAPVITKPTECECNRINQLKFEYENAGFTGTFSAYLAYRHGTTISQENLNTLLSMCDGSNECIFLSTPIILPPALQCSSFGTPPPKTCIDCQDYRNLKAGFLQEMNIQAPVLVPQNQADIDVNNAFAYYANYHTGFNKNWTEYVDFENQCNNFTGISCESLNATLQLFLQSSLYQQNQVGIDCENAFTEFFNATYNTFHTYAYWMQEFINKCGSAPDVCLPKLNCIELTAFINEFYDTYGVQVYKNANCSQLFTNYINIRLGGTNYSYATIQAIYRYSCNCNLDVCTFPNCFLLRRAYNVFVEENGGKPWELPNCMEAFVEFFNAYFGLDPYWDQGMIIDYYNKCFQENCGPDISKLCNPNYSCESLKLLIELFLNEYGQDILLAGDCKETFVSFFNTKMGTNYSTYEEIEALYFAICKTVLKLCNTGRSCSAMLLAQDYFVKNIDHSIEECEEKFADYFNYTFGANLTFEEIKDLYKKDCNISLTVCEPEIVVTDCPTLELILNDFKDKYPNSATQLGNECINVFTAYFNNRLGSKYSYEEIQSYYQSLCNITLDVCSNECIEYVLFVTEFNSNYNSLEVPLSVKKELFTFLYNKQFILSKSPTAATVRYDEIVTMHQQCMTEEPVTGNATLPEEEIVLLGLKQVFYLLYPEGLPNDCQTVFTSWYNLHMQTSYTNQELFNFYESTCGANAGYVCGLPAEGIKFVVKTPVPGVYMPPLLCGLNTPVFPPVVDPDDPCTELPSIAYDAAIEKWELYLETKRNEFDLAYYNKCMQAKDLESFTVTYNNSEYHYTLYYYDQAGNLVKTVPPAGVKAMHTDVAFLQDVKDKRLAVLSGGNETDYYAFPLHSKVTEYKYNTLNQVIWQKTPDAGESLFWYDRLGRLVVSQNAKQADEGEYSYTLYDDLGRITEVGVKPQVSPPNSRDPHDLANWLDEYNGSPNAYNKKEITRTRYDLSYEDGDNTLALTTPAVLKQLNLRNRVSYTMTFNVETQPGDPLPAHNSATFYSYDIHGNVKELVQDLRSIMADNPGNRFKKLRYKYDLISGKVNEVAYQPGFTDQFYHRYEYDAENRITDVYTSENNIIWERDARYKYYKHGPLARTVLGHLQVQGIDYAYTLQGWLKGVNSAAVTNNSFDMGQDAVPNGTIVNQVAKDVYSFSLNYFNGDYKPIHTGSQVFAGASFNLQNVDAATTAYELFNGNIASMFVNIPKLSGEAMLYGYSYDQLNRITKMDAFKGFNEANNDWNNSQPQAMNAFRERVSYDPNGNITFYNRSGNNAGSGNYDMDVLEYVYNQDNNQLNYVIDNQTDANRYAEDIDDQGGYVNYEYDKIGNLVRDRTEKIETINWTVYGKISQIYKVDPGAGTYLAIEYSYDASGNRISKTVHHPGGSAIEDKTTIYARDASGNVMSIYVIDPGVNNRDLTQKEVHLYGSSRLGVYEINRNVSDLQPVDPNNVPGTFVRGNKFFELTNHLGNVLVTISDRKLQHITNNVLDYYEADVVTANDYYPFGQPIPGRQYGTLGRYGFNGKEQDQEAKGNGMQYDYGFRVYDPRIGKFLSVDPLTKSYPWYTPYQFSGNNPIHNIDIDGLEECGYGQRLENQWIPQLAKGKITEAQYQRNLMASSLGGAVGVAVVVSVYTGGRALPIIKRIAIPLVAWASRPENQQALIEGGKFVTSLMTPPEANIPDDPTSVADDGGRALRLLVGKIWQKAVPILRGKLLEGLLSTTRYKAWNYVAGNNTKLIDFIKGSKAASLKTFDGQSFQLGGEKGFMTIVDKLHDATKKGGINWNGVDYKFDHAQLDIMFKDDATIAKFKDKIGQLVQYAEKETGGKVKVNIFVEAARETK